MEQANETHISEQEAKEQLEKQTGVTFEYSSAKYNKGLRKWSFAVQNQNGKTVFHAAAVEDFEPYLILAHHLQQPFFEVINQYVWIYGEECEFGLEQPSDRYCLTSRGWLAVAHIESAFLERFGKYRKNYLLQDEQWRVIIAKNKCSSSTYRKNQKPTFPPITEEVALVFKDMEEALFLQLPAVPLPHTKTEPQNTETPPAPEAVAPGTPSADMPPNGTIAGGIADTAGQASQQPEEGSKPDAAAQKTTREKEIKPENAVQTAAPEKEVKSDAAAQTTTQEKKARTNVAVRGAKTKQKVAAEKIVQKKETNQHTAKDGSAEQTGFILVDTAEHTNKKAVIPERVAQAYEEGKAAGDKTDQTDRYGLDRKQQEEMQAAQRRKRDAAKIQALTEQVEHEQERNNDAYKKIEILERELAAKKRPQEPLKKDRRFMILAFILCAAIITPFAYKPAAAYIQHIITPKYKVQFDSNTAKDGKVPHSFKVKTGAEALIPDAQDLSKFGYIFGGWNTNADGSGTDYEPGASYPFTENTILYAQWGLERFVHMNELNVRAAPASQAKSLFSLKQNVKALEFSSDSSTPWVKIKYNGKTGYVNGTYLRLFNITEILIGNSSGQEWLTVPSANPNLRASAMRFLTISVRIEALYPYMAEADLKIKIIDPYGTILQGNRSPNGYTYIQSKKITKVSDVYTLDGWGNARYSSYYWGKWRVEIWYANPANPSNTNALIASRSFYLQ